MMAFPRSPVIATLILAVCIGPPADAQTVIDADDNTALGGAPIPSVSSLTHGAVVHQWAALAGGSGGGVAGASADEGMDECVEPCTLVYENTLGRYVSGPSFAAGYWLADDIVTTAVTGFAEPPIQVSKTWYVDDDAPPGGHGRSRTRAFRYLQDALAASAAGDEIRVAGGIYTPDQDEAGTVTPGDRYATFQLVNGVAVRGGYRGCPGGNCRGGHPNERDIELYRTVLSGDLAGDDADVASPEDLLAEPTRAENSYHVVNGSWTDGTVLLEGFTIRGGNADGAHPDYGGGGMYNWHGEVTLTNCTFSGNSAAWGGGMYNVYSTITLRSCTFSENSTEGHGGGVYSYASDLTIENSTFWGNSAAGYGGGMFAQESSSVLTSCTFLGNLANRGGGMFGGSNATLTDCTFSGNSAGSGGGMSGVGNAMLKGCTFSGNTAANNGGGMSSLRSSPTLTNCTFSENSAWGRGGGMYNYEDCNPTLTNCTFLKNSAGDDGGGMWSYNGSPTLTNCTFSGNTAANNGGGMQNARSDPTLENCTFLGNSAEDAGGGMHNVNCSSPTLTNSTFSENSATDGRALACDSSRLCCHPNTVEMTNCILWDGGDEISNRDGSTITVTHGCVQDEDPDDDTVYPGEGNIDDDPMFVPGPAGSFYLSQTIAGQVEQSPCVDAGSDTAANLDLGTMTTRSDEGVDTGFVDMGYHYPVTGRPLIMGDFDRDGVLDLADFAGLQRCFTGPGPAEVSPCSRIFEFGGIDGDVDEDDYAAFHVAIEAR